MFKITRRSVLKSSAALAASAALADAKARAQAAYTPDDLRGTLTPFGGLRAGNADGSIPAWTGEIIPLPADYLPGTARPDPFPNEKPLYSITSANVGTYRDKLSGGAVELFSRYPNYRIDVYPTHRTAVAPQYVYDYIYKNASTAQISADGNSISNAYGGIPFPIPTTGKQVMWNHELSWKGVTILDPELDISVTTTGEKVTRQWGPLTFQFPYYFEGAESEFQGIYQQLLIVVDGPPYEFGELDLLLQPVDPVQHPPRAWAYLPGQRRVRLAPELEYDTPIDSVGGVLNWDESQIFYGPLDQYDCKLLGKKEMYVPYNANKAWATPTDIQFGAQFYNPDVLRWELHRVWVVEMTLAPGRRNVDSRRLVYVDEDTGSALLCDLYDASNSLWKFTLSVSALCSDVPCHVAGQYIIIYDFHAGDYASLNVMGEGKQWQPITRLPSSHFTPGQLSAMAGGS